MPFPRRLLTEGEEIVIDARPHWIALVGPVVVTLLLIAGSSYGLVKVDDKIGRWSIGGVALLIFLIYPLRVFISWVTSHFVVTNERLIHRQGLIAKTSMEVPLQRINDVRFHQTILERMVGAGDLLVESAGTRGQEVFADVRRPEHIQRLIYEQAEARETGLSQGPTAPAPAASTTQELDRLADLRDRGVLTEEEFQAQKAKLLGGS